MALPDATYVVSGFSRTDTVTRTFTTHSESETAAVGRDLAVTLDADAIVLLYGDLGAGKTAFVRGLAAGLGAGTGIGDLEFYTLPHSGPVLP